MGPPKNQIVTLLIFWVSDTNVNEMGGKHIYVSVMGTMGSGKSTAAKLISGKLHFQLLAENFGENAFLPRFYKQMRRWAFHSQTFFLMEKITQIMGTDKILVKKSVVQDTPVQQDALSYAKALHVQGHMDDAEWRLYQKIYRSFEPYFPKPDLIVYLDVSLPVLEKRIASRGRSYEQEIPSSYLELLDMLNERWLAENKAIRVLRINTDNLNLVRNEKAKEGFITQVKKALKN